MRLGSLGRRSRLVAWQWAALGVWLGASNLCAADPIEPSAVEGQPLAAHIMRVLQALELLGTPLPEDKIAALQEAARTRDAERLQRLLDPHVLFLVMLNPESRVKVGRGPAPAVLQQAGFTPVLVKVVNHSTVTKPLKIVSPQSGPVYAGVAELSMKRQDQVHLRENENTRGDPDRFLHLELFTHPPMTAELSGLEVEYAIALIYSSESGKREATIGFDVGQGTQDLGFRGEVPVLFDVRQAVPVKLIIRDYDGTPTAARLTFRDDSRHVYPPQPKRLAPDFFFQQQIYRQDGDAVLLPPGDLVMQYSRGPEYRVLERRISVPRRSADRPDTSPHAIELKLERWVSPMRYGFYCGDHHIHGAGCAHYTSPTEGVSPHDMFLQVKGEGLNVGCVLTWGPCFDFQRRYFSPQVDAISEPFTVLKYDLEISGFGSQALGHVCLLNLRDQAYPGSEGTKIKGWPSWTTPVLRWAKGQGAVTGYAHSASGLELQPDRAAKRLLDGLDLQADGRITRLEASAHRPPAARDLLEEPGCSLLPDSFETIDSDGDGALTETELAAAIDRAADRLPNLGIPEMNGVGAQEICVTTALGLCDFISAMDTPRIAEWNCWYHIMNCGFPLKVSGETDFPCMSSTRVGQGRVYVQLGPVDRLDFSDWCTALARGRSYVSDGYAHALAFTVNGKHPGDELALARPETVRVQARVAFALETPRSVAHGIVVPPRGPRVIGDTVLLHGPRSEAQVQGGNRLVELVVNGRVVASQPVPADGATHDLDFSAAIEQSSWVALRQFPQMHTNPVQVTVEGRPIRASRQSAQWCIETIRQLWQARGQGIAPEEREQARDTFLQAIRIYQEIAEQAQDMSL